MRINKKYKLFTTEVVEYLDDMSNEVHTEDGVITYIHISGIELEFMSSGELITDLKELL